MRCRNDGKMAWRDIIATNETLSMKLTSVFAILGRVRVKKKILVLFSLSEALFGIGLYNNAVSNGFEERKKAYIS